MPAKEVVGKQCLAEATERWNKSLGNPTPWHPDLKSKASEVTIWRSSGHEPAHVDPQTAMLHVGTQRTPDFVPCGLQWRRAFAAHNGQLDVALCRKLCETRRLSEVVDALKVLLERGCHLPSCLFYVVLKRCIACKDLVLGRCIVTLTIEGGYEGDPFLATQLISLYASNGRLAEARQIFCKVVKPNAYNWATIIFAYAKHGKASGAAEGIRLFRQMLDSAAVKPDDRVFSAVLKACATAGDLVAGKEVHAHIRAGLRKPDRFVEAGLIDMYAKCGSVEDARSVFDKTPRKNVVIWTVMIAGYTQQGMGEEALNLYRRMQHECLTPNSVTFLCVLQACATLGVKCLEEGKLLHARIKEQGLEDEVAVGGSLVNMYAKCGSLVDARRLFDRLPEKTVVVWNMMIAAYAQNGMGGEALSLYSTMQQESNRPPNSVTYACLLQACAFVGVKALQVGRHVHHCIRKQELQEDVILGGSLVNMYAKCGRLDEARSVFDKLPERSVVTWNAMLAGYAQRGQGEEALSLYSVMQQEGRVVPNFVTYVSMLQACAFVGAAAIQEGKQLHAQIRKRGLQVDAVLCGSLINMYAKCGCLEDARQLFDGLSERSVVIWNTMITGYAQKGMGKDALSLYRSMQQEGLIIPDYVTHVSLLQACSNVGAEALHIGKQLHMRIERQELQGDMVIRGCLVNMYAKCGDLAAARDIFDRLSEKTVVVWSAMLAGYVQQGMGEEALSLYSSMEQVVITSLDCVTFVCLLQACAIVGVRALPEGKQLHAHIKERGLQEDVILGGSLVNMYVRCGSVEDARWLFDMLPERNLVMWNTMLAGYAQLEMGQEALMIYSRLQQEGLIPDSVTYVCLLQACGVVSALPLGKQLHAEIKERGMQGDAVVGAALVNMYAKCGSIFESQVVFDSLPRRNVEAWGALLGGYARQGDSEVVFNLLDRMTLEGIQPDGITFLCVLTACSHAGLVDKGRKCFAAMRAQYGISPTIDHFTCMIDLLGRAGFLGEALDMVKSMPFPANGTVCLTLLSACLKWNNVEIGRQVFEFAVSLNEKEAAAYVLMSNIYARAEMWEAAEDLQERRKRCGAWKTPGQSWLTDLDGVVHTFAVGNKQCSESQGVYARLEELVRQLNMHLYGHPGASWWDMSDRE